MGGLEFSSPWGGGTTPNCGTGGSGGSADHGKLPLAVAVDVRTFEEIGG